MNLYKNQPKKFGFLVNPDIMYYRKITPGISLKNSNHFQWFFDSGETVSKVGYQNTA